MKKTLLTAFAALALVAGNALADETHTSSKFQGAKANTGTVTHSVQDGKNILTLSDDSKRPRRQTRIGRWWTPRATLTSCKS